ncbi:c-type cytochrome [Adhaeribacter sp. BT258]|uniref:C-type cytochrome n=1 Tax=Adhaeribacter terrigena TaxID=2793070 RepID=A0ABS1C0N4_9BACT|nr:c-type cytochrome [Adhaeribacter terrigena]MBK0402727.1 c-type cytochrome [Adhaeribacter terrigena]
MKTLNKVLFAAITLAFFGAPETQAQQIDGKAIFEANCKACHSITEDVVGPALKDIDKRRDAKWINSFVKNSQKMVQAGDKDAVALFEKFNKVPMPSFESSLKDADIEAVVAYIKTESEAPVQAEVAAPPTTPADPKNGTGNEVKSSFSLKSLPATVFLGILIAVFLLGLVVLFLIMTFVSMLPVLGSYYNRPENAHLPMAKLVGLLRGDTKSIVGEHKDVLIEDHSYDGIHEFDNDLPPWWKYSFYATIIFGIAYMLHYHVFETGKLQDAEYQVEMEQAALLSANEVSDPNAKTDFKVLTEATALESGKTIYAQNCAACHGKAGEGTVGPNLTDEFWLHGGDVNDIFKTVKFGVTSKGMVAWDKKLSKDQILEVSSYILSLQGTKPANGKAPQGEKYEAKK